ncbi:hypothetical protein FB45DRAFT_936185 [Roridomyces roridus]|uniref:Uncharacterized protein n=1 Tax=Roridomyces roridus TaxID=1738132 RepID=A0AAD7FE45_9AGAR|nr:hypothetical protein FB45DRAFT_936185 [Roridomyces roridus]
MSGPTLASRPTTAASSVSSTSSTTSSALALALRPDYSPYLSETTYPLPHIAHLTPIEIFKLNLGPRLPARRKHSAPATTFRNLRLREPPRAPPRVIEAPPPALTLIPLPMPMPTSSNPRRRSSVRRVSTPVPKGPRAMSIRNEAAPRTSGPKRASREYIRFTLWKGKGRAEGEGEGEGDLHMHPETESATDLRDLLSASALTRTDTRMSATSDIAFASPSESGASRYQKPSTPETDVLSFSSPSPSRPTSLSKVPPGQSSKLARMLGGEFDAEGRVRPTPALRLDTGIPNGRHRRGISLDSPGNHSNSYLYLNSPADTQSDVTTTTEMSPTSKPSKLTRILGAEFVSDHRRPTPSLHLDTRLRNRESRQLDSPNASLHPYLDSPHTQLGTPQDLSPLTPIAFNQPPSTDGHAQATSAASESDENASILEAPRPRKLSDLPDRSWQRHGDWDLERDWEWDRTLDRTLTPPPPPFSAPPLGQFGAANQDQTVFMLPFDDAVDWTGEWSEANMQEVIRKLRGLKK